MATIKVITTAEEQDRVLAAIKDYNGQNRPVAEIAAHAVLSQSRTRYVIEDLLDSGRIRREVIKAYNKHYVRYKYFIAETPDDSTT